MMSLCEAGNTTGPGGNKKKWKLNCTEVRSEWQEGFESINTFEMAALLNIYCCVSLIENPTSVTETRGIDADIFLFYLGPFWGVPSENKNNTSMIT